MDPEEYVKKHHLMRYIEDAIAIVMRKGAAKNHKIQPLAILTEYFHKVRTGVHVYSREYSYVSSTPYNRASFITIFWQCFYKLEQVETVMNGSHYHQLVQLLCSDFPMKIIDDIITVHINIHGLLIPVSEVKLTFSDFIYLFQVLFFYEEFLMECETIYKQLEGGVQHTTHSVPSVVVLPRLDNSQEPKEIPLSDSRYKVKDLTNSTLTSPSMRLSSETFLQAIENLCIKIRDWHPGQVAPSPKSVKNISEQCGTEITYQEFLAYLCKSSHVVSDIGILPLRDAFSLSDPPCIGKPMNFSV